MRILVADRGMGEPVSLGSNLLAGKKVAPDITEFLAMDHATVTDWFESLDVLPGPELKAQTIRQILDALTAHMRIEEEIFYPQARTAIDAKDLIDNAVAEHESAKEIMRQLRAKSTLDNESLTLIEQLRDEIEQHIVEEETILFPAVRASNLDLYAVGALCVARRIETLFSITGRTSDSSLEEMPMTPISAKEARGFFIVGLRNIHATATECRTLVERQIERLEQYPMLKARLDQHLTEKDEQLRRVENILQSMGESTSWVKDTAMAMSAQFMGMAAAAADDEILKNSFTNFALANFEAAAYETLLLLAEASGEYAAMRPLQESLSEERAMAAFVADNLKGVGMRFLQLRTADVQASH